MNRKEFINVVSKKYPINKKELEVMLEVIFDTIISKLKDGEKIKFNNFGVFELKQAKERKARNPQTGEEIVVPSHVKPVFKFSKKVKEIMNKKEEE